MGKLFESISGEYSPEGSLGFIKDRALEVLQLRGCQKEIFKLQVGIKNLEEKIREQECLKPTEK